MKQKLTALILAFSLALTLCACGGKTNDAPSAESENTQTDASSPSLGADIVVESNGKTDGDLPSDRTYYVDSSENFQENGLAWVRFHDNIGEFYVGAMDKTGELRFYFPDASGSSTKVTDFEDGLAFVKTDGGLFLIDAQGKVVMDYAKTMPDETIIAYGGGCVISSHKEEGGFDTAAKMVYTLTDSSGSSKTLDAASADWSKAKYQGSGLFSLSDNSYLYKGEIIGNFYDDYCLRYRDMEFSFNDEYVLETVLAEGEIPYAFSYRDLSTGRTFTFTTVIDEMAAAAGVSDQVGTGENFDFEKFEEFWMGEGSYIFYDKLYSGEYEGYWAGQVLDIRDGYVLLNLFRGADMIPELALCNTVDGSLKTYQGQYAGRMIGGYGSYLSEFSDRGIGLPLKGADGKTYYVFLDADLNELTEPVQMSDYVIDGDYIISDTGVRGLDGALLNDGSFTDLSEAISKGRVANGAIGAGDGSYFDYEGSPLFEEINFYRAKRVETN